MTSIQVRDLTKTFFFKNQEKLDALGPVNLDVRSEEFLCVVGPSGCGKSTLLNIIDGLEPSTSGSVKFEGGADFGHQKICDIVFQEFVLLPWRTVKQNIVFGLEMMGAPQGERDSRADHYLKMVGLSGFENKYPRQLSGGMKQRAAIARALTTNPRILLMDEPFAAIDAQTRTILQLELLRIWEQEKKTVVFITHAIDEAILLGDRVVVMTKRPGVIKTIVDIDLPRPRTDDARSSPEFGKYYHVIWNSLKEEVSSLT